MKSTSIFTKQFWLLCTSNFLFCASFQMLLPELPSYLSKMGGQEYIGHIIFLFTLTAGLSRPFSGKLTDTIGRVPIMIFGSIVCFFCGFLYPFFLTVNSFLFLRLFHGMSTGTKPTATAAYVADIIPENRRGEAMGMLAMFTATGMSFGPSIGSYIANSFDIKYMFYVSSLFSFLSIAILGQLKETLQEVKPFSFGLLKLNRKELFEMKVIYPFIVNLFLSVSTGVVITLIPDMAQKFNLNNKGLFFTVYTLASIAVRLIFPKTSDNYGRLPVLKIAALVLVLAMVQLMFINDYFGYFCAAILFGIAWGFLSPTISAWTIDLSDTDNRGKALATMYIALELGIGIGAFLAGKLIFVTENGHFLAFAIAGFTSLIALIFLLFYKKMA